MKKKVLLSVISLMLVFVFTFSACGKSADDSIEYYSQEKAISTNTSGAELSAIDSSNDSGEAQENRKLIKTVDIEAETKDFDLFIEKLNSKISEKGGYIQSSNISGNSYSDVSARSAQITIRVPADKLDGFSDGVSDLCNITSKSESSSDITMSYVDYESKLAAYEAEYDSLIKLMDSAKSVDSVITIQQRITDVIYSIESCKSQLRTYDSQVDYSTVNISVYEVKRETEPADKHQSVWSKISVQFSDNLYDIGQWFQNLFVYVLGNIPYILIYAILIIVAVILLKSYKKRRRIKKLKKSQKNNTDDKGSDA